MSWDKIEDAKWYRRPVPWLVLIFATVGFLGWPRAKNRYIRWSARQQVLQAAGHLAQGDFKRALLNARSALEANPTDVEATRVMARGFELAGANSNAADWRARLNALEPDDQENILAWAAAATNTGDFAAAERVLNMLRPGARANAGYHAAAAALATAKGATPTAEGHWIEALRHQPKEDAYRLPLAILRLKSKKPERRADALEVLAEISRKPPRSAEALRALLDDATSSGDSALACQIADSLVADPGANFDDKLRRLSALRVLNIPESVKYMIELRDTSLSNSETLYRLFIWMNEHNLAMMVSDWAKAAPPDVIFSLPTSVAVADALALGSEWERLREFVRERPWADWDFMRRAFLARAVEHLDEPENAAKEWADAIAAARSWDDGNFRLERLARLAVMWRWNKRAEEVMWIMTGMPGCPRWILDHLWTDCMERLDTAQLQRLSSLLLKSDPRSVEFRNRSIFFTLLTRTEMGDPHRDAEKLCEENPGNMSIAITRGLSLHQQGRSGEAVAVMEKLGAKELREPQAALYFAIFLTTAGKTARAAEFLPLAGDWRMFPEEKALLDRVKAAAAIAAEEAAKAAAPAR